MIAFATTTAAMDRLARQLKVLAEPNRLRMVDLLMAGVQCNCELGDALGMAPNLISHHLRILREVGLVEVERDAVVRAGSIIRSTGRRWQSWRRPLAPSSTPRASRSVTRLAVHRGRLCGLTIILEDQSNV